MAKQIFETTLHGKQLIVEIGELAKQADGAVLVRFGETVILGTAVAAKSPKEGIDFFPLTVIYNEKLYAIGKIPGGFLRREGRPSEHATLASRLIDRPIRPLFNEAFRNEVQVVANVFSVDPDHSSEIAAMFASSLALCVSDIPFEGPIAGVHVGRVNGKLIVNPTVAESAISDIQLYVAGTKSAINMVEAGAQEVPEDIMLEAIMVGHDAIKELIAFQEKITKAVGKAKRALDAYTIDAAIQSEVEKLAKARLIAAVAIKEKLVRYGTIDDIEDEVKKIFEAREYKDEKTKNKVLGQVKDVLHDIVKAEVRRLITEDKVRPDGRGIEEIRQLSTGLDLLPRVHGSAMFTRGETQVVSIVTLGALKDKQLIENLAEDEDKRFMHHYNFPPFSVGEVGRMGQPGRREIGHGALGERALAQVIPSEQDFPYTIRVVSEVLESNGSTSQASICASSMALMASGVPMKAQVGGIAMGLITNGPIDQGAPYTILTDIQGMEDHLGDMDFKVAGTRQGVCAMQMDIKISGINREILEKALEQARKARMQILDVMDAEIAKVRPQVGKYAPKIKVLHINPDKIREVIGPSGKIIKDIIAKCDDVQIDTQDDGTIMIYHHNYEPIEKAVKMIDAIAREAKVGEVFNTKVVRVEAYGCFVNLFGDTDALVHVSQLAHERVANPADLFKVGDPISVIITGFDEKGKVKASRKELLPKPEGFVERPQGERPQGDRPHGPRRHDNSGQKAE